MIRRLVWAGVRGVLEISRLHSVGAAIREMNAMGVDGMDGISAALRIKCKGCMPSGAGRVVDSRVQAQNRID